MRIDFGKADKPELGKPDVGKPEHSKYARLERERRYLLSGVRLWTCETAEEARQITDRYLVGTRFRLRSLRAPDGALTFRLTQKIVPNPPDYSRAVITTTFLDTEEYAVLAALPAHELRKSRYRYDYNGRRYSIDVFHGELRGLVLAETAFDSDAEMAAAPAPPFAGIDVSDDERFVGANLARTTWAELREQVESELTAGAV